MYLGRRAENVAADIAHADEVEDRESFIRRFDEEIDVAVLASLITRDRPVEEKLRNAETLEMVAAVSKAAECIIALH